MQALLFQHTIFTLLLMFSLQQFFNASAPSSNLGKTFTGMMLGYDVDNCNAIFFVSCYIQLGY